MRGPVKICWVVLGIAMSPVGMTADGPSRPTIYRCQRDSVTVFSDRPCDRGAQPYDVDEDRTTLYEPPAAESSRRASAPKAKRPRPRERAADSRSKHLAQCQKLATSLRQIRQKMRSGYGVEEGERLKTRHRELAEQRRTQRCP